MMHIWGMTDVGLVRKENQDAYLVREETATGHTICVVCDGMGGAAGGRIASRIAVETFTSELEKILTAGMQPQQLREASSYAVSLANKAIREAASQMEEYHNMGTTLVSAVSYDGGVVVSNVGDSRAYHITRRGITRVTKDHSLVERMVDRGDITAEEARRHPNRNLITRALGRTPTPSATGISAPWSRGNTSCSAPTAWWIPSPTRRCCLRSSTATGLTAAWAAFWTSPRAGARLTMSPPS